MTLMAHIEGGHGWGGPFELWELHPALNHLPIAFLLGAVALDLYAWWRGRPGLAQVATGMLIVGLLTGVITALAGVLAFFTVPGHTEEAHQLMYWHMAIQAAALLMFACPAFERWRNRSATPSLAGRLVGCLAVLFLLVGSGIGGYIVYHGGAGVSPELLSAELKHRHGQHDKQAPKDKDSHKDHKKEAPGSEPATEEQEEPEHDLKEKNAHKDKHADKEKDGHKGHAPKDNHAAVSKKHDSTKGHKQHDAHKDHRPKDKQAHEEKKHDTTKADQQQDRHEEHDQKDKRVAKAKHQHALPEVPPASASAAYVPKGYHVQIVLQGLNYPSSLEFDEKGNLYVAESGYAPGDSAAMPRVIRVQLDGEIETLASDELAGLVTDLKWRQGKLYISHGGKVSAWSEKEKLVDLVTGLPSMAHPHEKQAMLPGPDGKLYFGRGHRVMRLESTTGAVETFFGRVEDEQHGKARPAKVNYKDHATPSNEQGHEHHGKQKQDKANHEHGSKPAAEKKEHQHGKIGGNKTTHKDHAESATKDMKHDGKEKHEQQMLADGANPGPRRIMDIRFSPRGDALYVVDFGATFMTPDGPRTVPRTGVVWRITRDDAPTSVLMR